MYIPRLKIKYTKEILPFLKQEKKYKSVMQAPRLEKIVINQGCGKAIDDKKLIPKAIEELGLITGQRPIATKAKKSISNFKLRENFPIGVKVTLRKKKMYEFLDRLLTVTLPRVRDFKGVSVKGFDKQGNYNLGIQEQTVFPEINMENIHKITGMNITFVIKSKSKEESYDLLKAFGMPFQKK